MAVLVIALLYLGKVIVTPTLTTRLAPSLTTGSDGEVEQPDKMMYSCNGTNPDNLWE